MKNNIIDAMHSKIVLTIEGPNIERFILRIYKNKINILKLHKLDRQKYEIIINYADYDKLQKINTIYKIILIKYLGFENKKRQFFKYYYVLIMLLLGIILISFLSHIIFKVEIVTNDYEMQKRLLKTLDDYEISKYHFKKDYNYIEKVKEKILEQYHDEIEWVEIECIGTKYILRFEPRIIKEKEVSDNFRHIVAKKNAIIKKIYASDGEVVKSLNSYVNKGDIIVSGYISLNNKISKTVAATGKVYGEVWYETKVTYPFNYYEEKKTGNKKDVYGIKFFNKRLDLFNFHPFDDKIIKERVILKHHFLPITFVLEKQEEVNIITGMNVTEEVKALALDLAIKRVKDNLKDGEYIIKYSIIDSNIIAFGVEMRVFFSVCEDITSYVTIEEYHEEKEE